MVPHPRKVHVPPDTLRTWKWSPTPKMLSSIDNYNKQRNPKSYKIPETKIRFSFHNEFSIFLSNCENGPMDLCMVNTRILVQGFGRKQRHMTSFQQEVYLYLSLSLSLYMYMFAPYIDWLFLKNICQHPAE